MHDSAGAAVMDVAEGELHAAHIDEVAAPLRAVLRARLIDLVTLRRDLRLIVALAVAQLVAAALLLALKNASGGVFSPSLYAFPGQDANGIQLVSVAAFFIGLALTTAAWAFLLAGAFRAGVVIRVVVYGIFVAAFFAERDALDGLGADVHVAVYALLAVVAVLGVVTWRPEHRRIVDGSTPGPVYERVRAALPLLLFLLVALIYVAVFLASRGADAGQNLAPADTQMSVFTNDVFDQLDNVQYLLIPVLVLTGSDFAEWGQLAVARLSRRLRTAIPRPVFVGVVALACAGIAYDGVSASLGSDGGGWTELALAAAVFALAGLLYVIARPRNQWGTSIPFAAVAAVAILDSACGFVVEALQGSSGHLDDYLQLASAGLWAAGGIVAVTVLLLLRGRLPVGWCVSLIFVALIGATDLLGSIWVLGNFDNPPFGITGDNAPYLGPEGFRAAGALLTAAVLVIALLARRLRQWTVPITVLLIATVTMELLSYIDLLYANRSHLEHLGASGGLAVGGAAILIVALLMDLAVSGEAITNVSGRIFPRDTRVLAYSGYILLVAATVLMFASLHSRQGQLLESTFDADEWVKDGILFLGIPLTMTFAVAGLHRVRAFTQRAT